MKWVKGVTNKDAKRESKLVMANFVLGQRTFNSSYLSFGWCFYNNAYIAKLNMFNYNNLSTVINSFQSNIHSDKKACAKQGRIKDMIE